MHLNPASQELHNTFTELSFRNEASATVLEQVSSELPPGLAATVQKVIDLLRAEACTLRRLADRTQGGEIEVLE